VAAESLRLFIGGQWIEPAAGGTIEIADPSDGSAVGTAALASAADAARAVSAASAALPAWSATGSGERAALLERIAEAWERRADEIAESVTREMGMPIGVSRFSNGLGSAATIRFYAAAARERAQEELRAPLSFAGEILIRRNPVGVVAALAPWNFPCQLIASKLGPALAAGCTVVVKPAAENALTARLLGEVLEEAGVPAGVVSVIPGRRDVVTALASDPRVDKVAFTGSTVAGRVIGGLVGERLGLTNLELGGKSAAIVLDDADLDATFAELPFLAFLNSGQTCFAQTRVIATPGVYDEVVDRFAAWAGEQRLGSPLDEATTLGPLVSAAQRDSVRGFIRRGAESGARLVAGGLDAEVPARGNFVAPTVFADVDNGSAIAQEEIFGPVLSIIPARDEEHAVAMANDSQYGLAGSVWTRDLERGTAVARRIESGSVGVNGYRPEQNAPWGGRKLSGTGRENGAEAIDSFQRVDVVYRFGA
jgi:acyl-CoA reductase-like NAD-dependent aldehyde dehydrogenase